MNDTLVSLSKLFTDRLFRIPDYQRGYAWTSKEVQEFWNDLNRLEDGKNHYIGVLTLEPVPKSAYCIWVDDVWLIESKRFQPYFVVDGQQRLTTSILLIKAILNIMEKKNITALNYTSRADIVKRFISDSKDENRSISYLFGYELSNPSYDYLINRIYCGKLNDTNATQVTMYTNNLLAAVEYFETELSKIEEKQLERVFKKITQQFLFNTYEISSEIDVYITFETMNNRGKPLSYLELLKNRLIYLSTLFEVSPDIKSRLRRDINNCWKKIYHHLGSVKSFYLADDEFLDAHFQLFFSKDMDAIRSHFRNKYPFYLRTNTPIYDYLLDVHFVANKISAGKLTLEEVDIYINSLSECIQTWYVLGNPDQSHFSDTTKEYLRKVSFLLNLDAEDRLQLRHMGVIGAGYNKVLVLSCLQQNGNDDDILKFLKSFEKYLFLWGFCCSDQYDKVIDLRSSTYETIRETQKKLCEGSISISAVTENVDKVLLVIINNNELHKAVLSFYSHHGFYGSKFVRYLLCEYELYLQKCSHSGIEKLNRETYLSKGLNSVEHIYPQKTQHPYWIEKFKCFTTRQRSSFKNSLGNLVAISSDKNSRLANLPFPEKRDGKNNHVAYMYGTYAEIELTRYLDWGPEEIIKRGVSMISFFEERWGYKIGPKKADKISFLGLEFHKKSQS